MGMVVAILNSADQGNILGMAEKQDKEAVLLSDLVEHHTALDTSLHTMTGERSLPYLSLTGRWMAVRACS